MRQTRAVCSVCLGVFIVNFILFGVKLYIGLASNSISIFSDSVNNLFDSLSVLLTFAVLRLMLHCTDKNTASMLHKSEQLFSFLISIIIVFTGLYFAYSSLERFMYPTPVWYTGLYLGVLIATALVKLALFFFLRTKNKAVGSPVLRMVGFDSLLDFFISCVTVLTLLLSGADHFSFDALAGLMISIAITAPAVKMLRDSGAALINFVPTATREAVNEILDAAGAGEELLYIRYLRVGGETEGYAFFRSPAPNAEALPEQVLSRTGVILFCIIKSEQENHDEYKN